MVKLLKIIGYPDANTSLSDQKKSAPQNRQLPWHAKSHCTVTNIATNNDKPTKGHIMSFSQNRGLNTRLCQGCFHKCKYGYITINGKTYPMLGETVIKSYKAQGDYTVYVSTPNATEALKLAVEISKLCDKYKQR